MEERAQMNKLSRGRSNEEAVHLVIPRSRHPRHAMSATSIRDVSHEPRPSMRDPPWKPYICKREYCAAVRPSLWAQQRHPVC